MLEILIDLPSEDTWTAWRSQHEHSFGEWRRQIVESVRTFGFIEPITKIRQTDGISIDEGNLRETISAAQMNSRKRGTLLCLDLMRACLSPGRRQSPKILGSEALTRVGSILRGSFPYYLGSEYLPTPEEQSRHFPVAHVDLMNMVFADESFDLFHSGDVFEHIPDLPKALSEIARVLRPGGIAVSSFPFKPEQSITSIKARLFNGEVEHLAPPEFHGNPARPLEGSLVFSLPGWDILEVCRQNGFTQARMLFLASSTYGITSSSAPGVFVLVANKAAAEPVVSKPPRIRTNLYSGPRLEQVIGLLALPRSGTTLLSSVMGVHSRVKSVYEPWNSHKHVALPDTVTMDNFLDVFSIDMAGKPVLLIKETATYTAYIDKTLELLRSAPVAIRTRLIFLLRNPFHVFLSEFEARKTWWGETDLELNAEVFDSWAQRTITSLVRMLRAGPEFNAVLVSYEALVTNKEAVVRLITGQLGLTLEEGQLSFEKIVKQEDVRGDPKLARQPTEISSEPVRRRQQEVDCIQDIIESAPSRGKLAAIAAAFEEIERHETLEMSTVTSRELIASLLTQLTK